MHRKVIRAPPPVIRDSVADEVYDRPSMQRARSVLTDEHGGASASSSTIS
jgi:hypothetical protein